MKHKRLVCALAGVLLWLGWPTTVALAQPTGLEGHQVVRVEIADDADIRLVQQLCGMTDDFELWSEVLRPGQVDIRVSPVGRELLELVGLEQQVVIADLQAYVDRQYAGDPDADFFSQLRTYDEHNTFMQDLATDYPNLAQMVAVGESVSGRTIWGLRVSGPGAVKVGVLFHGALHGNEQATSSVIAFVADRLLSNYGTDPTLTALVDHVEWYLVPISNPDGYVRYRRHNDNGVDLNRNWDGPGSGQDPWGGPYPFSEPETQALRDLLVGQPRIQIHLDLHGYVPWIMWPWGHIPAHCPDHDTFAGVGYEMRDLIAAAGGGYYDAGTIYSVAYPVSGCSTNYGYGVLDLWAFGVEVQHSNMPRICDEFIDAMLYLGEWIAGFDCNGNGVPDADDILSGESSDLNGNDVPDECEALGDVNCDYYVDFGDINPFVLAVTDPAQYQQQFPSCPLLKRDINGDGHVDFGDVNPFVRLLARP